MVDEGVTESHQGVGGVAVRQLPRRGGDGGIEGVVVVDQLVECNPGLALDEREQPHLLGVVVVAKHRHQASKEVAALGAGSGNQGISGATEAVVGLEEHRGGAMASGITG